MTKFCRSSSWLALIQQMGSSQHWWNILQAYSKDECKTFHENILRNTIHLRRDPKPEEKKGYDGSKEVDKGWLYHHTTGIRHQ